MSKHLLRFLLLIAVGFSNPLSIFAQTNTYELAKIDSLQKTEKRNLVVFIYTDWCRYCHSMKNTTFKDDPIIKILNENFWFSELNGEEKKDIRFRDHLFKFKPTGNSTGIHELAEQLGTIEGQITYPTLCILNADYEIIFQYNQFISSYNLLKVLTEILNKS